MPQLERPGALLHYEVTGPADGRPVLYLPGFGSHSGDILARLLQGMLGHMGVRMVTVDNRGSGQTRITDPQADHSLAAMTADAAAALQAEGIASAHVLGISMGGALAALMALEHAAQVRSLTSVSSFAVAVDPGRPGFILETMRLLRDADVPQPLINRVSMLYLLGEAEFADTGLVAQWLAAESDPFGQDRDGWQLQVDALRGFDIRPRLAEIRTPTLVMSSPDDMLLPSHYQRAVADGIAGARWLERPGGHAFMLEPARLPQFITDLLAFWTEADAAA